MWTPALGRFFREKKNEKNVFICYCFYIYVVFNLC